jgi:cell division protein FtsI (penicillin-binding protein 3)
VTALDRRIGLLFALFLVLFGLALARSVWLQAIRGGELSADARSQQVSEILVPGSRGRILDRNGTELAVSAQAGSVFATPYQVEHPARTADKLAPLLDLDEDELTETLADRDSGFAYLARKVELATAERVSKLKIHGIGVLPDSRRVYPEGELASQLIGAVGVDNQGLTGLEATHEELLHGADGERELTFDALGEEIERETLEAATTGENLRLTLDASLQSHTEEVLARLGGEYSPAGATAVVMDPRNAHVLALANWPPLDPYEVDVSDQRAVLNRGTGFTYEPGSTFKAFTVASALEEGLVTPDTPFNLPPVLQVADRRIHESTPRGYATLTVAEILAQSSNVGAVKIGLQLGGERFDEWIRRFGFGEPTGIPVGGEERGIVLDPDDYSGSTMGNLPLGQGLSVTPIQMAAAYAAIANGGVLRTPQLILEQGGEKVSPDEGERVISERTAAQVRSMLEGVLAPGGTAEEVSVPGYTLAGKTGTSEKVIDGRYSKTRFIASFVGFAPAHEPELLVVIVVDEPEGDYYGGSVAAPAFGEIATFALPYLGIAPQ